MNPLTLQRRGRSAGNALIVTMTTLAIVGGFVGMAINLTSNVGRNVQRSFVMRQAANIGDAAMETAFGGWRATCINNSAILAPSGSFFTGAAIPSPSPGNFPSVKTYTLNNFQVKAADFDWSPITSGSTAPPPIYARNRESFSYYYIASADVTMPTMTSKNPTDPNDPGNITVHMKRIFEKRRKKGAGHMFNYVDDLEIHPGPQMVVTGDVHTNGSLYTGHSSLSLYGNTTFTGTWSVGFKPGDNAHKGETPQFPTWGTKPVHQDQAQTPYGVDSTDYHKLIEPITDTSDPLYPYTFANKTLTVAGTTYGAGIQIYIDDSGTPTIKNSSGTVVTSSSGGSNGDLYNVIKDALSISGGKVSQTTLKDVREGATTGNSQVRITTLDVSKITKAINYGDINLSNPVIYITDTSADPNGVTAKRGIRLKNGAYLPNNGLTIASGNPVYIQGDYNTGRAGLNEPPSNKTSSPNFTQPTVSGYDRKPAAVIGDAINVLSNNWSDANLQSDLSARAATNTTINAALIGGIVSTTSGSYSGGAENYPRFLENWSGKNITYYGSMNQLYQSKQAIGRWGMGNVYNAPYRAWFYDTNFLSNPPPGMPYTIDYRRGRWYTE